MHFMPLLVQNYRVLNDHFSMKKNGNENNTVITVILILTFDFKFEPWLNKSCNMSKKGSTVKVAE